MVWHGVAQGIAWNPCGSASSPGHAPCVTGGKDGHARGLAGGGVHALRAGDAGGVFASTTPVDCSVHIPSGPAVYCCLSGTCIYGDAAIASTCRDPGGQMIKASNYDQSCASDSDCVAVTEGDFCVPGANVCPMATINKGALAQYQADVAKTQAAVCGAFAGCPSLTNPCCRRGMCQAGNGCSAP